MSREVFFRRESTPLWTEWSGARNARNGTFPTASVIGFKLREQSFRQKVLCRAYS
jgi:hypothetical protein